MKYLGLFLAASQAAAHFHDGPPPPHHPSPIEHEAFVKVDEVCKEDVERHCTPPKETKVDPIMQWMMAPPMMTTERLSLPPPPLMHPAAMHPMDPINIGPLLDHMMDTALRLPMIMEPREPAFFMIIDQSPPEEQSAPEEFVLDSMVSRLMRHSVDCDKMKLQQQEGMEPVHDVVHHIRLKGQEVLDQEGVPEDRRRLARRLTEVDPEEMEHENHHHEHHRRPKEHTCLMQAREQNKLVPECTNALTRLEKVQETEMQKRHDMDVFMAFFWLYCVLFFALFSIILVRKFKNSKGLFLLRLRVLQAVYSNPEIKAKVEDEVGVPLGNVPPLPAVALKMLSADGRDQCRRKRKIFSCMLYVILCFSLLDSFGFLPDWWPLFVMGFCCVFMVGRMVNLCCSQPEIRECKCCCCGGSTSDVEHGTVSDAQACCTCCKGSGICAVKCSTCCGTGGKKSGTGSCCGGKCSCAKDHNCNGNCGCCGDKNNTLKTPLLKIQDDCKCCCCGATSADVANGLLTDTQACCTCCKGTGTCSAKCHTCCGGGGKKGGHGSCCGGKCSCAKEHNCDGGCGCCGDKNHTKDVKDGPKTVVYHGVPVQIV